MVLMGPKRCLVGIPKLNQRAEPCGEVSKNFNETSGACVNDEVRSKCGSPAVFVRDVTANKTDHNKEVHQSYLL